jgi:hypothetical protein
VNPTTRVPKTAKRQPRPIDTTALRKAGKLLDRAGTGVFRWIVKDHTGITRMLIDAPSQGFLASVRYTLKCFLLSVGITLARTILIIVLYILWIPFLIWALSWFLSQ